MVDQAPGLDSRARRHLGAVGKLVIGAVPSNRGAAGFHSDRDIVKRMMKEISLSLASQRDAASPISAARHKIGAGARVILAQA